MMRKQAATLLSVASLAAAAIAAPLLADDDCTLRKVEYNGWQCIELSNGRIDVVIAPTLGGRIIQLRLGDAEYLWVNPDLRGKVVTYVTGKVAPPKHQSAKAPEWANYGGDKLWPAPQGTQRSDQWPGPPDPAAKGGTVDNGHYELKVLAARPSEVAVRLTSPKDLYAGIRFLREICVREGTSTIELKTTMENVSNRMVRWGIWQVTQHGGHMHGKDTPIVWDPGRIDVQGWSPLNPESLLPNGYRVIFGPKTNPQFKVDDTFTGVTGQRLFRLDYKYRVGKVGMDNVAGWLAVTHSRGGYLYAHAFPPMKRTPHPDDASVEFWASGPGQIDLWGKTVKMSDTEPLLIESEVLSAFASLQPGQSFGYASKIHLSRGRGPIVKLTDAGAVLEPVRRRTPYGCTGKLALFRDGNLVAEGKTSASTTRLGDVRAGQLVDLGELTDRAKAKDTQRLRLVSPQRESLAEWPVE